MRPEDLKAGDQIVATEDAYFNHAPNVISQRKGDLIMVNNPNIGYLCGGVHLTGEHAGKGTSFNHGTFRRATPRDPSYMATRDVWEKEINRELRDKNFQLRMSLALAVFLLLVCWFR